MVKVHCEISSPDACVQAGGGPLFSFGGIVVWQPVDGDKFGPGSCNKTTISEIKTNPSDAIGPTERLGCRLSYSQVEEIFVDETKVWKNGIEGDIRMRGAVRLLLNNSPELLQLLSLRKEILETCRFVVNA